MKQINYTRYFVSNFSKEEKNKLGNYELYKMQIKSKGCTNLVYKTQRIKIFTAELAIILTTKDLPVRNLDTQEDVTLNGWKYIKTYVDAYNEGEQYFETEFKISPNILYGGDAESYVKDIHLNYFHIQHTKLNEGWVYVRNQYPIIITYEAIREFGYYSGIVSKVEEQIKKYPRLFATFNNCEHNMPSIHPIESPFSVLEWATIFYYASTANLLPKSRTVKDKMKQFMATYNLTFSQDHFKNKYYEVIRRLYTKNDYPIEKLKSIIPFLRENYSKTVTSVEGDIGYLEENHTEY